MAPNMSQLCGSPLPNGFWGWVFNIRGKGFLLGMFAGVQSQELKVRTNRSLEISRVHQIHRSTVDGPAKSESTVGIDGKQW